jgi:peroxiredoxin
MVAQAYGPSLNTAVSPFKLSDHCGVVYTLDDVTGVNGALLAFIGDLWHSASVRRILALQRGASHFAASGIPVTLFVRDTVDTLDGFVVSSPMPFPFPLLADPDDRAHRVYGVGSHPALLLIDNGRMLRQRWTVDAEDHLWPPLKIVAGAMQKQAAGI